MKFMLLFFFVCVLGLGIAVAEKKTYEYRMELTSLRAQAFEKMKEAGLVTPVLEKEYEDGQMKAFKAGREFSKFKKANPETEKLASQVQGLEHQIKLGQLAGDSKWEAKKRALLEAFEESNSGDMEKVSEFLVLQKKADQLTSAQLDGIIAKLEDSGKAPEYVAKVGELEKTIAEREIADAKRIVEKQK